MDQEPIVNLDCHCNNYKWGKKGRKSEVANLYAAGHSNFSIDENQTYSELWMGTHPHGPAMVRKSSTLLSKMIKEESFTRTESNNNLSKDVRTQHHLPYIMKVMSIDQTLSLQVHPTKEQAAILHQRDPKNYPDRNHKPELAYAFTRFELLCGFRPVDELLKNLEAFASLRELFGNYYCQNLICLLRQSPDPDDFETKRALKKCFSHMMEVPAERVTELIDELLKQLDNGICGSLSEDTIGVIRKINRECEEENRIRDVGVFSPLFLNHMILEPGECCYYAAEELHAYISGECVECVGCSNNTIRAAMTPKYIDRPALIEVLNYRMTSQEHYLVPAVTLPNYPAVDEYSPDCKDFQLHRVRVEQGQTNVQIPALECGSIMVILGGSGVIEEVPSASNELHESNNDEKINRHVKRGDIFYIRPGTRLRFASCTADLEGFRTFSYEDGPDHESRLNDGLCNRSTISDSIKQHNMSSQIAEISIKGKDRLDGGVVFSVDTEMDGCL
ncbi:unnamed protein product [Auanema sp. JU1783]|nr:unnamed protein product [Auanema sp. JU1783]